MKKGRLIMTRWVQSSAVFLQPNSVFICFR